MYPTVRMRRNRRTSWLRDLTAETQLSSSNLILPLFVIEGQNQTIQIEAMPGIFRLSIDNVIKETRRAAELGISAIALFPSIATELKTEAAEEAYNMDNLLCRTVRAIRSADIDIGIICDVALDPYTTHGHDGIFIDDDVDNDQTLTVLCKQALSLAQAGVDIIAPSDMMDGRVGAIRIELDKQNFHKVNILSYSAKYNSGFYGPFRDAVRSNKKLYLNKATYQMDHRNVREALREIEYDIEEGADIIMIKPGLPYLDVIRAAVNKYDVPIFAYQVSGEYAMLKFSALAGATNWQKTLMESLFAMRRAGALSIFCYASIEAAEIMRGNK